ncbi:MAG: hypothetical protein ACTSSM_12140, partial [Promethearchaeota archaeon]
MLIVKYKRLIFTCLLITIFTISFTSIIQSKSYYYQYLNKNPRDYRFNTQALNRTGKIFTNVSIITQDCVINRENPSKSIQPSIYIPGYNISRAKMNIVNITALNYTRDIEIDPTQIFSSSEDKPAYIYQMFSVELNQYINNVSIFIQDIINAYNYTEENSWEVAIENCTKDGIPSNHTLGSLTKPHPSNIAAHWKFFDFKNSESGPVFLNVSNTYHQVENGRDIYWFALRIKIPPDDSKYGGGPKFLYFNPDSYDQTNYGEGDTYLFYDRVVFENFTRNHVKQIIGPINGTHLKGNVISFEEDDNDRYLMNTHSKNISLQLNFNIKNISSGILNKSLIDKLSTLPGRLYWALFHYLFVNSIDFYITTNISNINAVSEAKIYMKNFTDGKWEDMSDRIDILREKEKKISLKLSSAADKWGILKCFINYSNNNEMQFLFTYVGNSSFDVSYNKFVIDFGERIVLNNTILKYDPLIQEPIYPSSINEKNMNGTILSQKNLDLVKYNDDKFLKAQADSNNLSLEFKFYILPGVNFSFRDVDVLDWGVYGIAPIYPNPIVPQIDFRISSNVSISSSNDLELATIEIYKGKQNYTFLSAEDNAKEWIEISSDNKTLANKDETTQEEILTPLQTWLFIQFINMSDDNSIRIRLRYLGNGTFEKFNVTIDEFSLNFYLQNIIPSDIACRIGLGLKNSEILPSIIRLINFGIPVLDNGFRSGIWAHDINNGQPKQGYFEFNMSSIWRVVHFDVNGTYELYKVIVNLEFIRATKKQYMVGEQVFEVKVTTVSGKPIDNVDIIFELLDSNSLVQYQTTSRTNLQGIASASIKFSNTGEKYSIRVRFDGEDVYLASEIIVTNIRVVDDFILFMDSFYNVLPYIIFALAGIVTALIIIQSRKSKIRRIWADKAKILDDLVNISYIMIIHKEVGVSIYNKQISLESIDSDLISGFLQAISQFKREFKKEDKKSRESKGFEMDYYDFKIIIT